MADTTEAGAAVPERAKKEKKEKKEKKDKPAQKPKEKKPAAAPVDTKGITVKKADNLADWYQQMISKGEFISYYDISGCYILEPASYAIWENIKAWFDAKIKTLGVRNCYYPVFISQDNLQKEKEHIEGFAAEVCPLTCYHHISIADKIRLPGLQSVVPRSSRSQLLCVLPLRQPCTKITTTKSRVIVTFR
jgi:prolyl-tRNA synthetase